VNKRTHMSPTDSSISQQKTNNPPHTVFSYYLIFAIALLFVLPFESVPIAIPQIQVLPFTTFAAIFVFLFFFSTRTFLYRSSPLTRTVGVFVLYAFLMSTVAVGIDTWIFNAPPDRILAWLRQSGALAGGTILFLILRQILSRVSVHTIILTILASSALPLSFSLLNVGWHISYHPLVASLIKQIRFAFVKDPYFFNPSRASGFSLEPAHYGLLLVLIFLPITFLALHKKKFKGIAFVCFIAILINIIFTFSITTHILFALFLILCAIYGVYRRLLLTLLPIAVILIAVFMIFLPDNYIRTQFDFIFVGGKNDTNITRLYGTLGSFLSATNSYTIIGYGLGGTATHIKNILPDTQLRQSFIHTSWENMPNITTLMGRIWVELGFIGFILFLIIFFTAIKLAKSLTREYPSQEDRLLIRIAIPSLCTLLFATMLQYGSFALPYLWFWLAVIDSRYLSLRFLQKSPT